MPSDHYTQTTLTSTTTAMGEAGLTSPLLSSSDQPHLTLTVHDDSPPPQFRNPFAFLGSGGFTVPVSTTADPFKNNTLEVAGVYEWLKIGVCLPIAIVRLVLFGVSLLVGFVATKLALLGWKDRQNPMPKWRCRIMWITRVCTRCILFAFGYHWIRRKGKPAPRATAPIVVSNHVSFIEPIFYFFELFPTIVASESHDSLPFVGTIIRAMQVIYVNRFSPSSRRQAVSEIKLFDTEFCFSSISIQRKAACDRFPRVLLFPEGTTTNGRYLISFELGAFIPGYPIQPVIVRYPHVHFDQSWGHISLGRLMFRMFTQFHNFMEVEYLPVVSPLDNKKESAFHFAQRTSHAMAAALNVVQTSHSFGDLMLLTKAANSKSKQVQPSAYMVEMACVKSSLDISSMEAVDLLDRFLCMNPDPSGYVTYHDFLRVLRLKPCTFSEEIFAFIDVGRNHAITFKQFLFGSAHVLKLRLFRQSCALAFSECVSGDNVYVLKQQFGDIIRSAIPDLDEDEMNQLFDLFDTDCDGRISKDDFFTCLRQNPLLIALFSPFLLNKDFSDDDNRLLEEIV